MAAAGAGGGTGATGAGIISLMNPNSFSTVALAASCPSSGLTCCGGGLSGSSMLRDDEIRLRDPEDANDPSRDRVCTPSSFCCPRDSKEGRRERRFSAAAVIVVNP